MSRLHSLLALAVIGLAACDEQDPAALVVAGNSSNDSDDDGFTDAEEAAANTDPADCLSVPMTHEAWGDCSYNGNRTAHDNADIGWEMGQVSPAWSFTDQFGDRQSIRRWHGAITLVLFLHDL